MGRPKSKHKFKLILYSPLFCNFKQAASRKLVRNLDRTGRAFWYIEYDSEEKNKPIQKSTPYRKCDYSREHVQKIIDNETGTKQTAKYSIDWLEEHTIYRLEIEGRADKTHESYKIAFKPLKTIYGGDYSILKIDRSAIGQIQKHLYERGNRPATINTVLRKLRAAFERIYIDGIIDRNPFYRFKPISEQKDRQKSFTRDEAQRLLGVLETHPNRKLAHLMRISLFTGIRRSEVLNIEYADVNLSERFFRAINIKSHDKHKVWRAIPEPVTEDFAYFMNNNTRSNYPFRVYKPNSYTCMTKKLLKKHGFNEDLHLHSCRHTAVTLARENGQDMREIQKIVDWSRMPVVEMYAHEEIRKPLNIGLE